MPRRWLALGVTVLALGSGFLANDTSVARIAPHQASAGDCASFGQAANFVAFSNGDFDASPAYGETITGRIAAAGNVTLSASGGGVYVQAASGDTGPAIIAGGDFSAGKSGAGGGVNGSVLYGGNLDVADNFTISGSKTHGSPSFSFDSEFESLKLLSASLANVGQTSGSTVQLNPYSKALELTGTSDGLNVFTVDSADLAQAAGVVINLTQPNATALINVTSSTDLTVSLQYENLSGTAAASRIAWNLPLASSLRITGSVSWQGLVLAPNATVRQDLNGEFHGQVIAQSIPAANRTLTLAAFTGCLPPPKPTDPPAPPDDTLQLTALCVNATGDLAMRLSNSGDEKRDGSWVDKGGTDFGDLSVPPHSEEFFNVREPSNGEIEATLGTTTLSTPTVSRPCRGRITVHLVTTGPAPKGTTWDVKLTDGATVAEALSLGDGETSTLTVPGAYEPGLAPIDEVVGGAAYVVTVPDTHGGVATASLNPVVILDREHEYVVVTIAYPDEPLPPEPPTPETPTPPAPDQPTLPPGAPDPPRAPELKPGFHGTDLAITHQITPRRVRVDSIVTTVTRIRNRSNVSAVGVVARELPQFRPQAANTVAHVLSVTTTRGSCTNRRPVRCELGTLAPGVTVTIRTRDRVLVPGLRRSVVTVSSHTVETNIANNMAVSTVEVLPHVGVVHAHVAAPPTTSVGKRLTYHVRATGGGRFGATSVRVCTKPPASLVGVRAPGTFSFLGMHCRSANHLGPGRSIGFTVSALARVKGHVFPFAHATAVHARAASHAVAHVMVVGSFTACPSRAGATRPGPSGTLASPIARAAC